MTVQAPVSLCIIVKNEPLLEQCVNSLRPYVKEIVIVDTGSTDGTAEVAARLADIYEQYTECNDPETGLIENFSQARQRSFDLATQPWLMWADADDIIVGGEKLIELTAVPNSTEIGIVFVFPYEYSYDENGKCTCVHYRERLFFDKTKFKWENPVHEVCVAKSSADTSFMVDESLIFKHQRQYTTKVPESGRNLRILKKYLEKVGDSDVRQLYYIGLEYVNNGDLESGVKYLTKYVGVSGWDDERAMACLKLVDVYQAIGDYQSALTWAFKTVELKESWNEGYLALARIFYFIAQKGGPDERRNWERCVHFSKIGLSLPPTKTLLFVNPLDRQYDIHRYLNVALNKIGDVKGAIESADMGLQSNPKDDHLASNKKIYEVWIAQQEVITQLNKLYALGDIDNNAVKTITAVLQKQEVYKNFVEESNGLTDFPKALKSSHVQSWKIPEVSDYTSLPIKLTDAQLQASVLMIWKQYMLHDEVLSAISFLENAPYNVKHSYPTQKALELTKACLTWMNDKDKFQETNAPANPLVEAGNPLPNKLIMAEGHRYDFVADRLPPASTVVDFGCMDGCFTNRYGLLGHKVTGIDACESSIRLAEKKAIEFNTGAEYVCSYFQEAIDKLPSKHFEYATCTDTYEHLENPVKDLFLPAKEMLKENGKFLLATPHGAWMRGQYLEWAHPWVQATEGKTWLTPFPRAHLVAPTVWTLAAQFKEAGYYVKDCYPDLCDNTYDELSKDIKEQGNIFAEAHVQFPANYDEGQDIIFFIGDGVEEWNPKSVEKTGIGGSELAAIKMSKGLAALGHKVRVYSGCGKSGEGIYDGVEYRTSDKFQDLECDILIISRRADMLADQYNIKANLKVLWVHDIYALNATNELLLKADRILALSEWHKQFLVDTHNLHPDHIIVTRNGIDLNRFKKPVKRNKYKCINSSSPDRSWPILLEVWPLIKQQVPQAELHLYYGFKNWEYSAQFDKGQSDLIAYLKDKLLELESQGVVFHDRVSQDKLAEEFLSAGAWIYPTWFTETSCIGAMEAQAAGLRIVTSTIAALNETVADRGVLIQGEWTSADYKNRFIKEVVKALKSDSNADRMNIKQYAEKNFSWDSLVSNWDNMFKQLLTDLPINPLTPYQPTQKYRK